jgi:hypothetical protein
MADVVLLRSKSLMKTLRRRAPTDSGATTPCAFRHHGAPPHAFAEAPMRSSDLQAMCRLHDEEMIF